MVAVGEVHLEIRVVGAGVARSVVVAGVVVGIDQTVEVEHLPRTKVEAAVGIVPAAVRRQTNVVVVVPSFSLSSAGLDPKPALAVKVVACQVVEEDELP